MAHYVIQQDGRRVILPPFAGTEGYVDVSVWSDSEPNYRRFAGPFYANKNSTKRVVTTAVLVHHAQNTYNRNAVSVSTSATTGDSLKKRHLGYLRDSFLNATGATNLPDLIEVAGGEVEVTVVLQGLNELLIDLPGGLVLSEAIRTFLKPHGIIGVASYGERTEPRLYKHSGKCKDTVGDLRLLGRFAEEPQPVTVLALSTRRSRNPEVRVLDVADALTGRVVGTVTEARLDLVDERDRDTVLALLSDAGIPTARPVVSPHLSANDTLLQDAVPNAFVKEYGGTLDIYARDPDGSNYQSSFAVYNPSNDVLWVEDSHLVAPALRYVHRLGLDPTRVGTPKRAWGLDDEISRSSLRDATQRDNYEGWLPKAHVLVSVGAGLPEGVLTSDVVEWVLDDQAPALPRLSPAFHMFEKHVVARTRLFPEHTLTGAADSCRICAQPAAAFTTPICSNYLAYCHACLDASISGLGESRERAAIALKEISALEFDDQPMLESQIATLHVNPDAPVAATTIDQLLLLRFAIPRRHVAWTLLLEDAGFAEHGLRMGRGTLIRSRDGHLCLSMREKAVCDFLHQHNVPHEREPFYPRDPDYNASGLRRADWMLADGTLVELWGLPKNPEYAAKMTAKRLLAERHGLRLLELFDTSLPNLPAIFEGWIPPGTASAWSWSPLLIATEAAKERQQNTQKSSGDNRGRNEYNTELRRQRVALCAEAFRLQEEEHCTRATIGQRLDKGPDTVKGLLRDGKFYADTTSDAERYAVAKRAAEAREHNLTRAEFQRQAGLTKPKTEEAWRDASILFED